MKFKFYYILKDASILPFQRRYISEDSVVCAAWCGEEEFRLKCGKSFHLCTEESVKGSPILQVEIVYIDDVLTQPDLEMMKMLYPQYDLSGLTIEKINEVRNLDAK